MLPKKIIYWVSIICLLTACVPKRPPAVDDGMAKETPVHSSNQQYTALINRFSGDMNDGDLQRAKRLIEEIKTAYSPDHSRLESIGLMEKYTNDTIANRSTITALKRKVKALKTEVARQGQALKDVRRSLVGQ